MQNEKKTKKQLIKELAQLDRKIVILENKCKRIEYSLQESENKYYSLLNTAPFGIMLTDAQGTIVELNEEYTRIYGYKRNEMIGKKYLEFIKNPELQVKAKEMLRILQESKNISSQEITIQNKTNCKIPAELAVSTLKNEDGTISYFITIIRNIREKKIRAEELQKSKEKYQTLVENINDVIFTVDTNGYFVYISPVIERISLYKTEEIIGRHFSNFVYSDDLLNLTVSFKNVLSGKSEEFEFRALDKGGKSIFIRTSSRPLYEKGTLIGLTGVMTDFTLYKHAQDDLLKFKLGIERSGEAIFITDIEGKILYINPAFEKIYGYSKDEVLGKTPRILKSGVLAPEVYKKFWEMLLGKNIITGELINKTKDGRLITIEGSANPILNKNEEIIGFLAIQRDITDRKRTEEALINEQNLFKTFMDNTPDAIFFKDIEGRFTRVNKAFAALAGIENPEKMVGKTDFDFLPDECARRFQTEDQKIIATSKSVIGKVEHIVLNENKEYWHLRSNIPIFDKNGSVIGIFCTLKDITPLKKMEEELINAKKLESLSILAGGIAHDFNNILATILGNISLVRMKMSSKDKNFERLTKAEKGCIRARDLTHQLLTFSRGGAPVKKLTSIVNLLKESIDFALRGSKIKCESTISDELWSVEVDEGQIHQVINNLILNADQSMPKGGKIKVQAENIIVSDEQNLPLKNGNYVRILIQDQGVGIAKHILPKIFDPYFTTKQKGIGLGLTTAYSIVKRHEGYIAVESKEGVGTTISVYLPALEKKITKEIQVKEKPIQGSGRILVMDDDDEIREMLSQMLTDLGYKVVLVKNGVEAIIAYKEAKRTGKTFDVVIMDLTIPGGMGGKDTIIKLQKIDPSIKAIVSSGYSNDPIMSNYKAYGFRDVIAKPYKVEKLSEIVYNLIKG